MTIRFQCKFCDRKYNVKDTYTGKRFQCKECEKTLTVPRVTTEESNALDVEDWDPVTEEEPIPGDFSLGELTLIGWILVIVLFGGGLCLLIWFFATNRFDRDAIEGTAVMWVIGMLLVFYAIKFSLEKFAGVRVTRKSTKAE